MTVEEQDIVAIRQTARRFAQREVAEMVGTEGRDGKLEELESLLKVAGELGLMACSDPNGNGFEYGIWGRASAGEGVALSLAALEEISAECAGVASCLHFAGLGALELDETGADKGQVAVAFFEDWRTPTGKGFSEPPVACTTIQQTGDVLTISGSKRQVKTAPGCDGYIVYGNRSGKWARVYVPADGKGVGNERLGYRTGLAAANMVDLSLEGVAVSSDNELSPRQPSEFLRRYALGLCAIALGNARGALRLATQYARERYQGGEMIDSHAAIQLLLGEAYSRIVASAAHVQAEIGREDGDFAALAGAMACKLRVISECSQAVTDCLQVLGGYGYMEDYRLEKRLRDALTLKSMAPKPDDLRIFLGTVAVGGES